MGAEWFKDVVFWALSVVAIAGAVGVVMSRDLFRAALLLATVFVAVGGFYVLMNAEFLAVVQILIYVGAIAVLFIFGVMLTRDVRQGNAPNRLQIPAGIISGLLLAAMIFTAVTTDWTTLAGAGLEAKSQIAQTQAVGIVDIEAAGRLAESGLSEQEVESVAGGGLADLLVGEFVLPFEAVSLLLLAAAIGGLALARGRGR
ncbi:MAG: NADH-quinone oxidoreductase subunit J [Chloroflexota bacterium]|nr:NADH-quinone oxidoreductase subunit J [Chloroflexota bacterium]MDE2682688.1 NADH-quinone oxidoreductase subunit J [Chloroflexota bacterium]